MGYLQHGVWRDGWYDTAKIVNNESQKSSAC
jgi:hypothetical protein